MKFPRRIVDTRALHLLLITAARISQGLGRRQRWAGRERFQSHWDGWSPHSPFDISRRGKKKKMKSAYTVLLLWDGKRRERRKNDHFEFFICCGMTPSVAEVVLTSRGAIYSPCWLVFFPLLFSSSSRITRSQWPCALPIVQFLSLSFVSFLTRGLSMTSARAR